MRIVTAGAIAVVASLAHAGPAPATPVSLGQTVPAGMAGFGFPFVAFQARGASAPRRTVRPGQASSPTGTSAAGTAAPDRPR